MPQEVDPEKILAEFEAARLAAQSRSGRSGHSGHPASRRPPVALIVTLGLLLFAVVALWILSGLLGGMAKPKPPLKATPGSAAPSASRSAVPLFCEVSPLPRLAELPKIPVT